MTLSGFQRKQKACTNAIALLLFWIAGSKEFYLMFIYSCVVFLSGFYMKGAMVDAVSEIFEKYGLEDYEEIYFFV